MKHSDFVLICPPPNVTGELHMGHSLNVVIQNFFVYSKKVFCQKNAYILPGFDHGGISTQVIALKNSKNSDFAKIEEFAQWSKKKIKSQMQKLNLLAEYKFEMYTFDKEHCDFVSKCFVKLYESGFIKRDKYIVNFDTALKTALSDLEVEYVDSEGLLYKIAYETNIGTVYVATTRPETIFADCCLVANPNDERYKDLKWAIIPIIKKTIPVMFHLSVDINFGTGLLKCTPSHDINDWKLNKEFKLPLINIISTNLTMDFSELEKNDILKEIQGLTISEARKKTLSILGDIESIKIIQKKPVSSKTMAPIEHLTKTEWFLDLSWAVKHADIPNIQPDLWRNNYMSWIENIGPWCISRDIIWGHPIPMWEKNKDIKITHECPGEGWVRTNQTLDCWFSSALWPLSYKDRFGIFPTDLIVTAYDILFFWIAKMVLTSRLLDENLPFKSVYIHRLVRDDKGLKMSKTRGNVINPITILDQYGYSTMHLALISLISPNKEINFSPNHLEEGKKFITKWKNAKKYIQRCQSGNWNMCNIKSYFLEKMHLLLNQCKNATETLQLHIIRDKLTEYFYLFCDWLIEFSKVRVSLQPFCIFLWKQLNIIMRPIFTLECEEYEIDYSHFHSYENIKVIEDLMSVICKIRWWKLLNINISIEPHEYSDLVCKLCNINVSHRYNIEINGFKLLIENVNKSLLNNKIFKIKEEINRIKSILENPKIPISVVQIKKNHLLQMEIDFQLLSFISNLSK